MAGLGWAGLGTGVSETQRETGVVPGRVMDRIHLALNGSERGARRPKQCSLLEREGDGALNKGGER